MSLLLNPVTGVLKRTLNSIFGPFVGSAWVAAWLIVTFNGGGGRTTGKPSQLAMFRAAAAFAAAVARAPAVPGPSRTARAFSLCRNTFWTNCTTVGRKTGFAIQA